MSGMNKWIVYVDKLTEGIIIEADSAGVDNAGVLRFWNGHQMLWVFNAHGWIAMQKQP